MTLLILSNATKKILIHNLVFTGYFIPNSKSVSQRRRLSLLIHYGDHLSDDSPYCYFHNHTYNTIMT